MRCHFKTIIYALVISTVVIAAGNMSVSVTYTARPVEAATEPQPVPPDEPPPAKEFIEPDYTGLATVKKIVELPHELRLAEVSAYTSSVDETDSTPNINAMGTRPGPGSIACPSRYKFGTKVIINGDEFSCDDRMNPRYDRGDYFDIWMQTKSQAMQWGRRIVEVKVIE